MEKKLDLILAKLERLEVEVNGIKAEHGDMLKALLDNKEHRNAKMDSLDNNVAVITGVLTGFNNSLEPLRKLKKVK